MSDFDHFDHKEYDELLDAVLNKYGYDFTGYAESSAKRRIRHFMDGRKLETISNLRTYLLEKETSFEEFVQAISVTVTEMFRDPVFFKSVREQVINRLETYPLIKVWIAGCATGEEAYSIAILLKEAGLYERSIIYATDINQRSLQIAREGIYPLSSMKLYTNNYLGAGGQNSFSEYYTAKYNSAVLDRSLSKNIVFSPHNLATDGAFNEFQLIICRNVLMYFKQQLQQHVVDLFYTSLCAFGFLGIGDKESLVYSDKRQNFLAVEARQKLYKKVG